MDEIDKEFLAELMAAFREEADERLHAINHELLAVERTLGSAQAPEHLLAAFKAMHSLKGAARAVALVEVEQRCEQVEGTLARIVSGDEALTRPTLDALFKAVDAVNGLLAEPEGELSFVEAVMGGELSELEGAPTLLATEPAPLPSFVAGPVEARAVPAAPESGDRAMSSSQRRRASAVSPAARAATPASQLTGSRRGSARWACRNAS